MAEFPVTCSCGTEFIADDEGGSEIQCPTCGNVLHLEPEPIAPVTSATTSYFRCPRCERPVEHERMYSCPRCGADLRPGGGKGISDDTFRRLIEREIDVPPPPFYGRVFWILFRPARFFRHARFEEGFHSALLFFLVSWFAPTPLVAATWHIVSMRRSLLTHEKVAESAAIWTARGAAIAFPMLLLCASAWATVAHFLGRRCRYESDLGAMIRVACYSAVPLPIGLTTGCVLTIFDTGMPWFGLALPFLFWTLALQVVGITAVSRAGVERAWLIAGVASALVTICSVVVGSRLAGVLLGA